MSQLVQINQTVASIYTAQKMTFSMKNFFSKYDQICSFLRIWSHLLKKSLMEKFIFCSVLLTLSSTLLIFKEYWSLLLPISSWKTLFFVRYRMNSMTPWILLQLEIWLKSTKGWQKYDFIWFRNSHTSSTTDGTLRYQNCNNKQIVKREPKIVN